MPLPLHRRTQHVAAAGLLVLGAALATAAAPPASAAPRQGCQGRSCYDKDPIDTGCADDGEDVPGASASIGDMTVQMRYSADCNAAWARARTTPDLRAILIASHGATDSEKECNDLGSQYIYTKMVDGGSADFVCIYPMRGDRTCGPVVTPSSP